MIKLSFEPHSGQLEVLSRLKRFNVLQCGRRFGKTVLMIWLMLKRTKEGEPCAWYSPTYKDLNEVWGVFKHALYPIIESKSEQLKQLTLKNGVVIDFWSLDQPDSGRGRKYGFVVVDECEKARHFMKCWQGTIRPSLSDYKGGCCFISTPKLGKTDFKELGKFAQTQDDWAFFQLPTSKNPFIDKAEILQAQKVMPTHEFKCEYLAEDTDTPSGSLFAWSFDKKKHVKDFEIDYDYPLDVSFDFNVIPCTATISQQCHQRTWKRFLYEIRLGTIDKKANIYNVCSKLKAIIPDGYPIRVTGDASGQNNSALVYDNLDAYDIIQSELNLSDSRIWTPKSNPKHEQSYFEFNERLTNRDVFFHSRMDYTIEDLGNVEYSNNKIMKKEAEAKGMGHLLDCVRYDINTFFY